MDPFSITVGVAGLLVLVSETIKLSRDYVKGVRHATEAANELLDVLEILHSTLYRLDEFLSNHTKNAFSNTSVLFKSTDACKNKLVTLQAKLQGSARQPLQRLRWPLNSRSHQETLEEIRAFTQWIQFGLTIDGSILLSKTSDEVVEVLSKQLAMIHRLGQLETHAQSTHKVVVDTHRSIADLTAASEREKILDWISKDKPEQKHHDIRLPRLTGTGQWLLEDPSFKRWRDRPMGEKNTLWCHGIPGSGKSVLA